MHEELSAGEGEQEAWQRITAELRKDVKPPCARCHCPAEAHEHYAARWHCDLCRCPCYLGLPRWLYWPLFEMSGWVWTIAAVADYAAYWGFTWFLALRYGHHHRPLWGGLLIIWGFLLYIALVAAGAVWCLVRARIMRPMRRGDESRGQLADRDHGVGVHGVRDADVPGPDGRAAVAGRRRLRRGRRGN